MTKPVETGIRSTLGRPQIHDNWQSAYRQPDVEPLLQMYFRKLASRLDLKPVDRILDAGCGTAFNAVRLAKLGFRVDGVDFSNYALDCARAYAAANSVADLIKLSQGDLTRLEIADDSYDTVFCLGVLMHIPDVERAIRELVRVTRKGGTILIGEGNRASPDFLLNRLYWRLFKRDTVRLDRQPGFTRVYHDGAEGEILARCATEGWLIERLREAGGEHLWTHTGDLTELYARNKMPLRKPFLALNRLWFILGGPACFASGFYAAFRKL